MSPVLLNLPLYLLLISFIHKKSYKVPETISDHCAVFFFYLKSS